MSNASQQTLYPPIDGSDKTSCSIPPVHIISPYLPGINTNSFEYTRTVSHLTRHAIKISFFLGFIIELLSFNGNFSIQNFKPVHRKFMSHIKFNGRTRAKQVHDCSLLISLSILMVYVCALKGASPPLGLINSSLNDFSA